VSGAASAVTALGERARLALDAIDQKPAKGIS